MTPSGNTGLTITLAKRIGPVSAVFLASLLLSWVAIAQRIAPNDDGMLYVEAARLFREGGFDAARQVFDWLFLPVLIGGLSALTGLGAETAAYLLTSLLIAGLCALLVACARRLFPEVGWPASVVVLGLPALNRYRDYILREFGAWCLLFLAFWLFLAWQRKPGWGRALVAQLAVCGAALFRLESLIFLAVPVLWQLVGVRQPGGMQRLLMVSWLPLSALLAGAGVLWAGEGLLALDGRAAWQVLSLDLVHKQALFDEFSAQIATAMPNKYAAEQTGLLIFWGALGILLSKVVGNFGVFAVPAVWVLAAGRWRELWQQWAPLSWAFAVYAPVPVAFVLEMLFLSSRYVALLNLLMVPLLALGVLQMWRRLPRWRAVMALVAVLACLSNVVTTSPAPLRHVQAAQWLRAQQIAAARTYVEPRAVSYLAGGYRHHTYLPEEGRSVALQALRAGQLDVVIFEADSEAPVEAEAAALGLQLVERFADRRGRAVYVLRATPGD
ncbi:MAG TPA: hypothetical protein PL143_05390 [Rhodocyclaceae bacterium]|nr:hypothetical protein [Rhodocyclaceae bacterium]